MILENGIALGIILPVFSFLLYRWLRKSGKQLKSPRSSLNIPRPVSQFPMTQQDQRYIDMIKRIDQAFKEQHSELQTRALKPHATNCEDLLTCTTSACFKLEPDKIIEISVVKRKTIAQRKKELADKA